MEFREWDQVNTFLRVVILNFHLIFSSQISLRPFFWQAISKIFYFIIEGQAASALEENQVIIPLLTMKMALLSRK